LSLYAAIVGAGFIIGFVVGRWPAILAVIPFAGWLRQNDLEIPWWVLPLAYGSIAAAAIAAGIIARRGLRRVVQRSR
jgi:hypothetical protein